ncbi:MAG: PQQ-binding-like beta-propeller repeat protein [Planctomycetales bacterium]|nr:PQQ-binding-like beta-propeller repeat protein [Planctomycetales bacterium]
MSAHAFLDQLERQRLLDAAIIEDLRRQVDGSSRAVNAETIAKLLVDNGHLTKFQATKLVSDLGDAREEMAAEKDRRKQQARAKSRPAAPPPPEDEELGLLDADDELVEGGLQPLDSGGLQPLDGGGLQPLDGGGLQPLDGGGLQPLGGGGLQPLGGGGLQPLGGGGLQPLGGGGLEPLGGGGLEPLGGGGLEPLGGGGLELLGGGGLDSPGGDALSESAEAEPKSKKGPKKIVNRANVWDSPLLLGGGVTLLILLIVGTYLFLSLTRGNATEMFGKSEEDYRNGSYTAAIAKYEKFLKQFPSDPNASMARTKIGLCRLRTAIENSTDPQKGLEAAREQLPLIEPEEAFGDVRPELASLLPDLALKFAERADDAPSIEAAEQSLAKIDEAMVLVNNPAYIPSSLRNEQAVRIDLIEELKSKVDREIGRNRALESSVAAIEAAAEAGDTAKAYAERKTLLRGYPGLATHPDLVAAVDKITARAQSLVANQPLNIQPITEDVDDGTLRVLLAGNSGRTLAGADKMTALARVDGAAYGVDAAEGRVRWRRFIGYDTEIDPLPISADPGSDVLVSDGVRHELVRVKSEDGSVVWRLPLGEPFHAPVVSADEARVIVSTQSGLVVEIDTATGAPSVSAKIPQRLTVGPGRGDARRPMIYQVADNDNLYVINTDDLLCKQVYHLGHKQGAVQVPPVMAVGHVFVAVNTGPRSSMLYVLAGDENGQQLTEAQPPLPMEGHINTPLMVAGRRVAVVTDLGAVNILDVAPQKEDQPPVSPAVKPRVATFTEPTRSYPLIDNLRMWIGDSRLIHYEVQTAKGEFVQKEIGNQGDAFVGPLQHMARGLIHLRKQQGAPGVTMRAVNDRSIEETIWSTELGVPAAKVVVDGARIFVVSGRGQVYPMDGAAVQRGFATPAGGPEPGATPALFTHAATLPKGITVCVSQSLEWLAVDPAGRQQRRQLQGGRGAVVGGLATMGDGVVVPLDSGQVVYADLAGRALAHPFQPQLEAGGKVAWRRPAVITDTEFAIANDRRTLYLVEVNERGAKHLGLVKEQALKDSIVSPLAFLGGQVWGVVRTNEGDFLTAYDAKELKPGAQTQLEGRVTFGPVTVDKQMFVATTGAGLVCIGEDGSQRWQASLTSQLAAPPTLDNGSYLVGLVEGRLMRLNVDTGETIESKQLNEPIRGEVLAFNGRVLTTGADGTLLVTSLGTPDEAPAKVSAASQGGGR